MLDKEQKVTLMLMGAIQLLPMATLFLINGSYLPGFIFGGIGAVLCGRIARHITNDKRQSKRD